MISAAALLSSCGIYNKYERPEVNATGLVRDVASATDTLAVTDTTSFGNLLGAACSLIRSCSLS